MEKVRVMIVDDSKISRAVIKGHLSKTNFEVVAEAKNAAEAVELYMEKNPTIVTMDMNLPDADGIECARRIRAYDKSAKIVMVSAMRDAALTAAGRDAGITAFLQKPVSTNDLIDTLLVHCQGQASRVAVLRESYAKAFVRALQQGIHNLIGITPEMGLELDERRFLDINGISVIVGLTGTPAGRAILYMSESTQKEFARLMLGEEASSDDMDDAIEEAANVIVGRGASNVNDIFKDKEMRITPPGTISGKNIRIASPKLTTFKITADMKIGTVTMSVGFAEGE